jgi:hypothetical protein
VHDAGVRWRVGPLVVDAGGGGAAIAVPTSIAPAAPVAPLRPPLAAAGAPQHTEISKFVCVTPAAFEEKTVYRCLRDGLAGAPLMMPLSGSSASPSGSGGCTANTSTPPRVSPTMMGLPSISGTLGLMGTRCL